MSSIMDATPSSIHLECQACHRLAPICVCFCDVEVCEACTAGHLALCAYAKSRKFRSWTPAPDTFKKSYRAKREKRTA